MNTRLLAWGFQGLPEGRWFRDVSKCSFQVLSASGSESQVVPSDLLIVVMQLFVLWVPEMVRMIRKRDLESCPRSATAAESASSSRKTSLS